VLIIIIIIIIHPRILYELRYELAIPLKILFDTVPHRRLLSKIKSYNINQRLILWIQDFLCSRKQSIGVNGEF